MPMPLWWGHINKRVFNRIVLRGDKYPVMTHVGRTSGATYRTPMDALPTGDGYVFILVYGSRSDWVRNVLASGSARLRVDGKEVELTAPRLVGEEEAFGTVSPGAKRPPKMLKITEFLRMDLA
ncbi:hypothetical protein BBK82_38605 [Lentzea guizhouensis]|uniref:Nitroreductase n=1 Tax=Lentzea guizhouensis TaxID=1586287 RepID=A0A1B2HTG4_9PSEU|nr:nitroreductase family deazaflavin-dependent oxidoreductase [Lentzea guizhouensis]ANZ41019.1 hypothetical protein BBK82_38605 [Lentzea guizhouensis]